MDSISLLVTPWDRPEDFNIAEDPPVRPRLEVTMNEYMAGNRSNAERAAIISRMMITVTKGVIASIGIR